VLAVGHEIDNQLAQDFSHIVASEVVFQSEGKALASSIAQAEALRLPGPQPAKGGQLTETSRELQIGRERYLVTTVSLGSGGELDEKRCGFVQRLQHAQRDKSMYARNKIR
jgi:hypothetical protein